MPLAGGVVSRSSAPPSLSVPSSETCFGVPGTAAKLGPKAWGEALAEAVTAIVTAATFESSEPSLALNVKLSVPVKPGSGV